MRIGSYFGVHPGNPGNSGSPPGRRRRFTSGATRVARSWFPYCPYPPGSFLNVPAMCRALDRLTWVQRVASTMRNSIPAAGRILPAANEGEGTICAARYSSACLVCRDPAEGMSPATGTVGSPTTKLLRWPVQGSPRNSHRAKQARSLSQNRPKELQPRSRRIPGNRRSICDPAH